MFIKKSNWVSAGLRQKATSTSWSVGIDWKVIEDIQENKLCWIDKWTVSRGSSKFQGLPGWHGFRSTYAKLTNIYFKSAEVFWCNPVSNDGVSSVSKFWDTLDTDIPNMAWLPWRPHTNLRLNRELMVAIPGMQLKGSWNSLHIVREIYRYPLQHSASVAKTGMSYRYILRYECVYI